MKKSRKLSAAQKASKRDSKVARQKLYRWIFIDGKQVRIKRSDVVDEIDISYANLDPVWLHQNERWDVLDQIYSSAERAADSGIENLEKESPQRDGNA